MSDGAAEFIGILVLLALFVGWCYMSYRVAVWVFRRGVQKELERNKLTEQQEKEAIANRLREELRRKELEEQVRREMIERGELPPGDK